MARRSDSLRAPRHPLERVSTIDALASAVTASILDGGYQPGAWIREAELAADYGVSRHSLRAALVVLVRQGLLRREPHRGVYIPVLTAEDVMDLYRTRSVFELNAIRHLATEARLADVLPEALRYFERLHADSHWSEVVEADVRFHRALVDALQSPRMSDLYANLLSEFRLCIVQFRSHYYESSRPVVEKHHLLAEQMAHSSPDAAVQQLSRHLADSETVLLNDLLCALQPPDEAAS